MLFVISALGAAVFDVIAMLAVDVQPLAPVTVTVYVPADVILRPADEPAIFVPSDHE